MPILAFLVMVAYWQSFSSGNSARWIVLSIGLPIVSTIDYRRFPIPILRLLFLGCLWAAVFIWRAPNIENSIFDLYKMILLIGIMFAASQIDDITSVMKALCWGLVVNEIVWVGQILGWIDYSVIGWLNHPAGLFVNVDYFAETTALVLVWTVLSREWLFSVVLAIPLFVFQSRVALVMLGVGLFYGLGSNSNFRYLRYFVLFCIIALAGLTTIQPGKIITVSERLDIWSTTVSNVTVLGYGIGSFTDTYIHWEYSHSDILQALYELGIGSIPFVIVLVWLLTPLMYYSIRTTTIAESSAFLAATAGIFIGFPLHWPATGFIVALLAGRMARGWYFLRGPRAFCGVPIITNIQRTYDYSANGEDC